MSSSIISGVEVSDRTMFDHICGNERNNEERITEKMEFDNDIGMNFKLIPAGELNMGSMGWKDSLPCHRVSITRPFYIGTYPVTQWEWEAVMGYNPSHFKGDERPVEMVSWRDCKMFIDYLNLLEDTDGYRLPSEVEWEYACRAGDPMDYYFNNDNDVLDRYAWFRNNSDSRTHDVGKKKTNKIGLHDMLGNVWEWCEDNWHENYYGAPHTNKPWLGKGDLSRVDRGGSWESSEEKCTSTCRDWNVPLDHAPYLGFRLVLSL